MGDNDQGALQNATDGVVAGTHDTPEPLRVLAGPATGAEFNTIRAAVFPVACFKVENIRFDFDSSLIKPELRKEMPVLAQLLAEQTEAEGLKRVPPLSVFGHADPVGGDDLNKKLSGRRAAAVYGMLTRRTEVWEDLFGNGGKFVSPEADDPWGTRSLQLMLNALPASVLGPPNLTADNAPDEPLNPDGTLGTKTRERIRRFQAGPKGQAAGLGQSGTADAATRKALFLAYMDFICVDAAGVPFKVDPKTGFLAQQADAEGKGDFQGCSEFNPVLLFSQADLAKFNAAQDKTERNAANAENRRVMVLLFAPGSKVKAALWPCPKAKEGVAGCKKRFWADGEKNRTNTAEQRRFEDTKDTFACRFYQRLISHSPCEGALTVVRIRLFDRAARALPAAPCIVTEAGKAARPDRATGTAPAAPPPGQTPPPTPPVPDKADGFITFRVSKIPTTVNVKWSAAQGGESQGSAPPKLTDELDFELDVVIDIPEENTEATSLSRLKNLGYVQFPDETANVKAFQTDYQQRFPDIRVDGTLSDATMKAIKQVHDDVDPNVKPRQIVVTQ